MTEMSDTLDSNFLYPPRPKNACPLKLWRFFHEQGWIAQVKKNGTCSVIRTDSGKIEAWKRTGEKHIAWQPNDESCGPLKQLKGWTFAAELLHTQTAGGPKNTLYIFDCMVANGNSLIGITQKDRMAMIREALKPTDLVYSHHVVTEKLWIARDHEGPFDNLIKMCKDRPEDEGLVWKDPTSRLTICRKDRNADWQVKGRFPQKNYSF